jgi:hypothetical protein
LFPDAFALEMKLNSEKTRTKDRTRETLFIRIIIPSLLLLSFLWKKPNWLSARCKRLVKVYGLVRTYQLDCVEQNVAWASSLVNYFEQKASAGTALAFTSARASYTRRQPNRDSPKKMLILVLSKLRKYSYPKKFHRSITMVGQYLTEKEYQELAE